MHHTTPSHPQSDRLLERFNRTLINMLATTVGDHPREWEGHLSKLCVAYNTSVRSSTGFMPFKLTQVQLKLCPPSMRGVDGGVRSNCHVCSLKERMDRLQPKHNTKPKLCSVMDLLHNFDSLRLHAVKL